MKYLILIVWSVVSMSSAVIAANNLSINGDFEKTPSVEGGVPHWTILGSQTNAWVTAEDDNRFVRLYLDEPSYLQVTQQYPVGEDWTGVKVSGKVRIANLVKGPEGYNTVTVLYTFKNAAGKHVGTWPQKMFSSDQDWTSFEGSVTEIPAGAAMLVVQCSIMNASGQADFDDIEVRPIIPGSAAITSPRDSSSTSRGGATGTLVSKASPVVGNLTVNGDFEKAPPAQGGVPNWSVRGSQTHAWVAAEEDNQFVRLYLPKPDYLQVTQQYPVGEDWTGVKVSGKVRIANLVKGPEGYNTVTLLYTFKNAAGKHVGNWPQKMFSSDQDWTSFEGSVTEIPAGAAMLVVQCSIMNASGQADFDDIEVRPIIPGSAPATADTDSVHDSRVDETLVATNHKGNLLVNGDFTQGPTGRGVPVGWNVGGDASRVSVIAENGVRALSLDLEQPGYLNISQQFKVGADWSGLDVSARVRVEGLQKGPEGYNTATLLYVFNDARGEHVGPWYQTMFHQDQAWEALSDRVEEIPAGATTLAVRLALMNAAGRVEFADVVVQPKLLGEEVVDAAIRGDDPSGVVKTGGEPVEELGYQNGRICLNGYWKFQPALGAAVKEPLANAWGYIPVPGSWIPWRYGHQSPRLPTIEARGSGSTWKNWNGSKVSKAWYERSIEIPEQWDGRDILLNLTRISTDAKVFLDGVLVGETTWPDGLIDLTKHVDAGESYALRVQVTAQHDQEETMFAMGVGQNTMVTAILDSRGIIGEVFLLSRPAGVRVDGVWVVTSVRNKEIKLDVDLSDVASSGPAAFQAKVLNAAGEVVKTFEAEQTVSAGDSTVSMEWPWQDPLLWDVGQPNLYTLDLTVRGQDFEGGIRQTFGFREFWIEGRDVYLNGTPFRLRPYMMHSSMGNAEVVESSYRNMLDAGFNIVEVWPRDLTERGSVEFVKLVSDIADEVGMPLMGHTRHVGSLFKGWVGMKWDDPVARAEWQEQMVAEWKTIRNSPSIVMLSSSGNILGHRDDQEPRRIGRDYETEIWKNGATEDNMARYRKFDEMISVVKEMDPTRPYMFHQGASVGDVYSVNNYLCLIPLQEREEWLSDWAENGNLPFCSIEFGTPLSTTMYRGRNSFMGAMPTEPLATEFIAVYLGKEAYELEQDDYRNTIAGKYVSGQDWHWPNNDFINYDPGFQKLGEIFIENTWKSWRTMGITAGMVPWTKAHGFENIGTTVDAAPLEAGQRGVYSKSLESRDLFPFGGEGVVTHSGGEVLIANNSPTLAWLTGHAIDGDIAAFTAKDHSFSYGETVHKQVALLNDSRVEQPWSVQVTATLDGKVIDSWKKSGVLEVGVTQFVPFDFTLPTEQSHKGVGELKLVSRIGDAEHVDDFAFHVFSELGPLDAAVSVFDPVGETTPLLESLGLTVTPWKGEAVDTLVLGRNAMTVNATFPASLEDYVRNGGRLLIMSQDPAWLKEYLGLRTAGIMSRRVFRMDTEHPVVAGLDESDLADWRGFGTLLEAKPDYSDPTASRTHGWRWGTRGTVSSATLEKPHRSGWRPLIEAEFDLAYSPLMELDFGSGRVVFATFDLEDHADEDAAAKRLARNILNYVITEPLAPATVEALYVGDDEGAETLDLLGLVYRRANSVEASAPLVVLGPDVSADAGLPVLKQGGRVLVLPRRHAGPAGLGITVVKEDAFSGSLQVPEWDEARGLSPSDLRLRVDLPSYLLEGAGVESDGLLAKVKVGDGVALFVQSDPLALPAEEKQYLRYTRWRQTRTLTQLLANLGAEFSMDRRIFEAGTSRIKLDGEWKVQWTRLMATSASAFPDPGMSEKAIEMVQADADESGMREVILPSYWKGMDSADGEAVFRKTFQVPEKMLGQELIVGLGYIDDFDDTYINGVKVGSTGASTPEYWATERYYRIPADLLKAGDNVIAVRAFDNYGGGGFRSVGNGMAISLESMKDDNFYYPDYRSDFKLGDDPYRYYRW